MPWWMQLCEFRATRMSTDAPFVILVSGVTASGKSSIVGQFVAKTGAAAGAHVPAIDNDEPATPAAAIAVLSAFFLKFMHEPP